MRRLIVLALLLGLMTLLQTLQAASDTTLHPLSLATFGFVLLAAYTLGQVAANVQLPKITGYIITGLVFGPQVADVFSSAVEADLRVVNDLAIGLIALSAGAEMHVAGLRKIAKSLFWIVAIKGLLILVAVTGLVFALSPFIPFLAGQPPALVLSVGMILGVLAIGTSPAATIAVINETGAKGRLADTTLGVAVAKDIVMVVLLAVAIALTRTFGPGGHGFEVELLTELALDLFLSLLAGAVLGIVIIGYVKYVGAELWLFVVGVIFAMTAIALEFHLEALLVFIVAGFTVQNASTLGHGFVELVERVALPVYVVFFSVAGAGLDLAALYSVLPIALALVAVRMLAIFVGTGVATRVAGEPESIRRTAWMAFVAQAGVVIGLSIIVENNLPALGPDIRTLVMGTVAIHLLLGPVLFKLALTRAGEVKGAGLEDGESEPEVVVLEAGALPVELEEPLVALEWQVTSAMATLQEAAHGGPRSVASGLAGWPEVDRAEKELSVRTDWARQLEVASIRFWSGVHHIALAVPRQITVPLEESWYAGSEQDRGRQRWMKRLRRVRRGLKRLSGAEPVLYREVPFRALALYHLDEALSTDMLRPIARVAALPAHALRDGLVVPVEAVEPEGAEDPAEDEGEVENGDDRETAESEAAVPPPEPVAALGSVLPGRFDLLRLDLGRVGTIELSAGRRRASTLHEQALRSRRRAGEVIAAWNSYARALVAHRDRLDAVEELQLGIADDSSRCQATFRSSFDAVVVQPVDRARRVIEDARLRVRSLLDAEPSEVESALRDIEEAVSLGMRREALAGLRRSVENKPLKAVLRDIDDRVEARLAQLPTAYSVIAPDDLPDPSRPFRTYPSTAEHEFALIATGAVERTIGPSLEVLDELSEAATMSAADSVLEVRELLELRFDAALDAAIDEARTNGPSTGGPRESLQVATSALERAASVLDEAYEVATRSEQDAVDEFSGDLEALVERLETELTSARALEVRLQARRARVELEGQAVLRLTFSRVGRFIRGVQVRLGLKDEAAEKESPSDAKAPLRAAGRAGSDRAVLFGILFDHDTLAGKVFDGVLILTILVSIGVLMLESVVPIQLEYATSLLVLEWLFTLLFTAEYVARLWAVNRPARYATSFFGVIDLLAVLPTYLSLILPGGKFLMVIRVLRVARAFRVFKLARYVGESQVLLDALRASRYKITVFLVYVLSAAVVMGSMMYLIEGPESGFTSIPRAVYWSIVTLTTVGFGDITPQSPLGQALAAILMVLGYGIIAVPTGIVTAQIASQPALGRLREACPTCGRDDHNPTAAYCLVCGTKLAGP